MGRVSKATAHLTEEEIQRRIHSTVGFWKVQKWLVILNATVAPRPAREIALHTGLAEQTVRNLISVYNRIGPRAVEGKGKGGRRRSYMTWEEEKKFLNQYINKTLTGQITTVYKIKEAFEKRVGKIVHKTTIYRLLDRHGWRKIVPRPKHINSNKEKQEEFKKKLSRVK